MLNAEEIVALGLYLEAKGFPVVTHQLVAAQTVVHAAVNRDRQPDPAGLIRLASYLRPIFSSTPDQQEQFDYLYLQWVRQRTPQKEATERELGNQAGETMELPQSFWKLVVLGGVALVLSCLILWLHWHDGQVWLVQGQVISDEVPVVGATVRLGGQAVTTDKKGTFAQLSFRAGDLPIVVQVEKNGFFPGQVNVSDLELGQALSESRAWLYGKPVSLPNPYSLGSITIMKRITEKKHFDQGALGSETGPRPPQLQQTPVSPSLPPTPVPPWWERIDAFKMLLVVLPFLAGLGWWGHEVFWRRPRLKREASQIEPALREVKIAAGTDILFPSLSLRAVTQRLRQPRMVESDQLDVEHTIAQTVQRVGWFTPVYGTKREPTYLALIDRAKRSDHQANMAAQLVRDLIEGGVDVRQFEYDEQPARLRQIDPRRPVRLPGMKQAVQGTMVDVLSLHHVRAKYPDARLICFADPITFFDPLSGEIRSWVAELEQWEERFLLSANEYVWWTEAERLLRRRGFQVIPFSRLGLKMFMHLLEGQADSLGAHEERDSYYGRRPARWLDRYPPAEDSAARLLQDLEQAFKDQVDQAGRPIFTNPEERQEFSQQGMLWLAACAAYPEIHWPLTLEWGRRLFPEDVAERLLPALTRLIWFRRAYMPDWVRQALYDRLANAEQDRISQELSAILSAVDPERSETLRLEIGIPPKPCEEPPASSAHGEARTRWFTRLQRLFAMAESSPPDSPLRDYVTLQYLAGSRGRRKEQGLAPAATTALLKALFPQGHAWLPMRPGVLLGVGIVLSLLLAVWQRPIPPYQASLVQRIGLVHEGPVDGREPNSRVPMLVVERENGQVEQWQRNAETWEITPVSEEEKSAVLTIAAMGQVAITDPTKTFLLQYDPSGAIRLLEQSTQQQVAHVDVPASQIAALLWPEGQEAWLAVVVPKEEPELHRIAQIKDVIAWAQQRRSEKAAQDARVAADKERVRIEREKQKDAKRLADLAAKKTAEAAARQVQVEPPAAPQLAQSAPDRMAPQAPSAVRIEGGGNADTLRSAPPAEQTAPPVQSQDRLQQGQPQETAQQGEASPTGIDKRPAIITGKDGAPMVLVPEGEFTMGAREDDREAQADERPAHRVFLDAYYIDQYEVTTSRYAAFMEATNHDPPSYWLENVLKVHGQKPVVGVTWEDANAYCVWAGKRLPTEAEWEKAARGMDGRLYPWGNEPPTKQLANFDNCCDFQDYGALRDVGSYEHGKSPYGAYDMAGNAWEWVADWYDETRYQQRAMGNEPVRNPQGPDKGEFRVLRGGSWDDSDPRVLRSSLRFRVHPSNRSDGLGFRCAQGAP